MKHSISLKIINLFKILTIKALQKHYYNTLYVVLFYACVISQVELQGAWFLEVRSTTSTFSVYIFLHVIKMCCV